MLNPSAVYESPLHSIKRAGQHFRFEVTRGRMSAYKANQKFACWRSPVARFEAQLDAANAAVAKVATRASLENMMIKKAKDERESRKNKVEEDQTQGVGGLEEPGARVRGSLYERRIVSGCLSRKYCPMASLVPGTWSCTADG